MPYVVKSIASLVFDESIWPRHKISESNIGAIREAILAEAEIPPILIDAKSSRVVDGIHRMTAFERLYGAEYEIEVETKRYRDKEAMLADAISLNIGRGEDLTRWDMTRCVTLAEEVGMSIDTLAKLVKWQPDRLTAYRDSRMSTTVDDRRVMLKRSLRKHLKPLTKAQEEVNKHASGMAPLFHINQTIAMLETDLMPVEDHIIARLKDLAGLIEVWLNEQEQEHKNVR